MEFDDIVVGAGASGAVLAARLSENRSRRVLLVEAGPDYETLLETPPSIQSGKRPARDHDWGYVAEMVPDRPFEYPRGKLTGGSSAVNACLALRGLPGDYDEWADSGNSEWSWEKTLPVFKAIETDREFASPIHGTSGPIPIRRFTGSQVEGAQQAFELGCMAAGYGQVADHNHPEDLGVGPGPWNIDGEGVRVSTAVAYLLPARGRWNLQIKANCLVDRIMLKSGQAEGVIIKEGREATAVYGARVHLCGGSIGSPSILQRSGIGPREVLERAGIRVEIPLDGVGANLVDHAGIGFSWEAPDGMVTDASQLFQNILRFTAEGSAYVGDMQALLLQALPQPALKLRTNLLKPLSKGSVHIQSAEPTEPPKIRLNLASHPEDQRRLMEGLRVLHKIVQTRAMIAVLTHPIHLDDGARANGTDLSRLIEDPDALRSYIHRTVRHYYHPVGSVRMGKSSDRWSVVDQYCKVKGVDNLRVVDASVMPSIPRANTNLPCLMIAEKVASWLMKE